MAVKIFFCYAHEDELLLNKLKTHLRPLQRQGLIDVWHDRDISAGTEWEQEVSKHLNEADIILLLVSPDFINSDYCYSIEMKQAIERHERGDAIVIPVILRPCLWQQTPISKLQAVPTDGKLITGASWHNADEALFTVAGGIRTRVVDLLKKASPKNHSSDHTTQSIVPQQFKPSLQVSSKQRNIILAVLSLVVLLGVGIVSLALLPGKRWSNDPILSSSPTTSASSLPSSRTPLIAPTGSVTSTLITIDTIPLDSPPKLKIIAWFCDDIKQRNYLAAYNLFGDHFRGQVTLQQFTNGFKDYVGCSQLNPMSASEKYYVTFSVLGGSTKTKIFYMESDAQIFTYIDSQ